jgi:hypothetical protein
MGRDDLCLYVYVCVCIGRDDLCLYVSVYVHGQG